MLFSQNYEAIKNHNKKSNKNRKKSNKLMKFIDSL